MTETAPCPVCLESLPPGKSPRVLECGHRFHARCVHRWFRADGANGCPCCRHKTSGPAYLEWLSKSRAKLSTRLASFVDTLEDMPPTEFWPAWLMSKVDSTTVFDDSEKQLLKDLSFQSFDKSGFFAVLKQLENNTRSSPPGPFKPSRSDVL